MRKENSTSSHLAWLMLGLNALAAILLAGGIWYLRSESVQLQEQYTALANARINANQQEAASTLLLETVQERALIAWSIITESNLPNLIEQLEEIAEASEAELELTQATPSNENNPNITLAFNTSGSYSSLMRFTRLLDALPVQMHIKHAQFQLARQSSEETQGWQATYYIELLGHGI